MLATVAAGLYVSWNGPLLIPAATRLQGIFFWDLVVYYLEGFVFLVTGMQMRALLDRSNAVSLRELGLAIPLVVAVVVIARFIWAYPAVYLPRWLKSGAARRDPMPPWQWSVPSRVRRRARRRFAGRGARHSVDDHGGRAVSRPRSHSVRHLRRHRRHADRRGAGVAADRALARFAARRRGRAAARAGCRDHGADRSAASRASAAGRARRRRRSRAGGDGAAARAP